MIGQSMFKLSVLLTVCTGLLTAAANPDWHKPFTPHRVIGNVYYVGTYDLAVFLITSPEGHILINSGMEDSVPQIRTNLEKLGFQMKDIRILLTMQAHDDHVAGLAQIQKATDARMLATGPDAPVLADGGRSDFAFGGKQNFAPVRVDRKLEDGEIVRLGANNLTVHLTPGHTKGSVSYTMPVHENGRDYTVLFANMPTIPGFSLNNPKYPQIVQDYARSFRVLKALNADVFLSAHAAHYRLHEKYKPGQAYSPNTFVDPAGYKAAIAEYEKLYNEQLARERISR